MTKPKNEIKKNKKDIYESQQFTPYTKLDLSFKQQIDQALFLQPHLIGEMDHLIKVICRVPVTLS